MYGIPSPGDGGPLGGLVVEEDEVSGVDVAVLGARAVGVAVHVEELEDVVVAVADVAWSDEKMEIFQ